MITVTQYTGRSAASVCADLREQMRAVYSANPFIAGQIVRKGKEEILHLMHPPQGSELPDDLLNELVGVDTDFELNSDMTYNEIVKVLNPANPPKRGVVQCLEEEVTSKTKFWSKIFKSSNSSGFDAEAKGLPCRLSVVPDSKDPENKFALVTSMSHVIGDGAVHSAIFGMLSMDPASRAKRVRSLNVTRKPEMVVG